MKAAKLDALRELLAQVEAGTVQDQPHRGMPLMSRLHEGMHLGIAGFSDRKAVDAYHGSLDAAKALHEAMLPGVTVSSIYQTRDLEDREVWGVRFNGMRREEAGRAADPARAWLIAVIKALIAQEEAADGSNRRKAMTDKTLAERLRAVTAFCRFETGDRVAASACLSEEAADALDAKDTRIAELEAALDSHHAEVGSNIWRWWSDKARDFAQRNAMLYGALNAKDAEIERLRADAAHLVEARPGEEYHDDFGPVMWHRFPIDEAPWVGTPDDSDWPGYHTHFTILPPYPHPVQ